MEEQKLTEYELINPSDPYTFLAPNLEIAAMATIMLGRGQYGAKSQDGELEVPIFLFANLDEWCKENCGRNAETCLKELDKTAVADALESVMLGHFEDRRRYNLALDAITNPEKREQFIRDWQDGCSSLNDIGTAAHQLAKAMRKAAEEDEKAK